MKQSLHSRYLSTQWMNESWAQSWAHWFRSHGTSAFCIYHLYPKIYILQAYMDTHRVNHKAFHPYNLLPFCPWWISLLIKETLVCIIVFIHNFKPFNVSSSWLIRLNALLCFGDIISHSLGLDIPAVGWII